MTKLTGADRKFLRSAAHHLDPAVRIGKGGITDAVLQAVETALDDHELIKIKFMDFKKEKRALSEQIAEKSKSERVGLTGHVAILYRQNVDPEKRKIDVENKRMPEAEKPLTRLKPKSLR